MNSSISLFACLGSFAALPVVLFGGCGPVVGLIGASGSSKAPASQEPDYAKDPDVIEGIAHYDAARVKHALVATVGPAVAPLDLFTGWSESIACELKLRRFTNNAPVRTGSGETLAISEVDRRCRRMGNELEKHKVTTCGFRRVTVVEASLGGGAWNEPQVDLIDEFGYVAEDPSLRVVPCGDELGADKLDIDDNKAVLAVRASCGRDLQAVELGTWKPIVKPDMPPQRVSVGKCWYGKTTRPLAMPPPKELRAMQAAAGNAPSR